MEPIYWIVGALIWTLVGIVVAKIFWNFLGITEKKADKITDDEYINVILAIIFWPFLVAGMILGRCFRILTQWITR